MYLPACTMSGCVCVLIIFQYNLIGLTGKCLLKSLLGWEEVGYEVQFIVSV